ncbi:hypothetical protein CRG98_047645 [Punica granatum]|uniref:RNase H type-1 domain-containing protein n=1 Tax=Punica granatum TaxID=22663 RepID=A0A2I0HJM8_PUNGR|nr:hypothetical protein CRG98_047645 [Punica granatum]
MKVNLVRPKRAARGGDYTWQSGGPRSPYGRCDMAGTGEALSPEPGPWCRVGGSVVKGSPPEDDTRPEQAEPSCGGEEYSYTIKSEVEAAPDGINDTLINDENGLWKVGFTCRIAWASSVTAKLWALRDGLQLATNYGLAYLEVELDARVVYNII